MATKKTLVYEVTVDEKKTVWRLNGTPHREDGPAIEWRNGTKEWCINGVRHREGGPAIEWVNGGKEWWVNGHRHRTDGPACEWPDGTKSWRLNGMLVTEEKVMGKKKPTHEGKFVEIDGVKYKLTKV